MTKFYSDEEVFRAKARAWYERKYLEPEREGRMFEEFIEWANAYVQERLRARNVRVTMPHA